MDEIEIPSGLICVSPGRSSTVSAFLVCGMADEPDEAARVVGEFINTAVVMAGVRGYDPQNQEFWAVGEARMDRASILVPFEYCAASFTGSREAVQVMGCLRTLFDRMQNSRAMTHARSAA